MRIITWFAPYIDLIEIGNGVSYKVIIRIAIGGVGEAVGFEQVQHIAVEGKCAEHAEGKVLPGEIIRKATGDLWIGIADWHFIGVKAIVEYIDEIIAIEIGKYSASLDFYNKEITK